VAWDEDNQMSGAGKRGIPFEAGLSRRAVSCHAALATMARKTKGNKLTDAVETSATILGVIIAVHLVELVTHLSFAAFGIVPRTRFGLVGILFSPVLHANGAHLLANAVPLFVLLILLFWDRNYQPAVTLAVIWLASGFGTWLIGRGDAVHIGASSVIFGLVTYLIAAGFVLRRWRAAMIAALVAIFFGGLLYGALPQPGPISWEGHLSGAIAGIWAALRQSD